MLLKRFSKFKLIGLVFVTICLGSPFLSFQLSLAQDAQTEQFHTAAKAFSDGFYDASLSLFERFIKDFPASPLVNQARLYLAKGNYHKQDYRKALKILSSIEAKLETSDLLPEVYYWLTLISFKGKDFDKAVTYAKKNITNYPNSEFRYSTEYLLGQSYESLGKLKEAKEAYSAIISDASADKIIKEAYLALFQIYLQEQNHSQLQTLSRGYLKKFKRSPETAKVYFYLAESHYFQGNWNKARSYYQQALAVETDPAFKDLIYRGLGFSYVEADKSLEAKIAIDKIKDKQLRLSAQGAYYFKSQDYLQALETFNMFIRDYPESSRAEEVYLNKADVLYELGRLNDAIYVYQHILDNASDQSNPEIINKAHYGLAWSYLKNGKFKKAIDEFKDTLEYAASPVVKVSSQIHIADAYQETGKYSQALDIYSSILEDHPNTIYADYIQFQIGLTFLKKKDLDRAFLALKNLKNNFSSSKLIPQAQYYLAVGYFSQADYSEAQNLLKDFIDKFPKSSLIAKAHYLYGKCFFNQGNHQKALRVFKAIIGKFSDRDIEELVYVDMGNTYLHLSLFEQAKKTWTQFLKKYPNSDYRASVALYLGGLSEKEGNFLEAEKRYLEIYNQYQDAPGGQEAMLALGHLYWNNDNLEKAEEYFKRLAASESPLALKSKLYLAKVLAQGNNQEAALKIYNQLTKTDSSLAKVSLLEKAFLLKDMKQYSKAAAIFKKVIALDIDTQELRFSLGVCLEKIGKPEAAIEQYFKAVYNFADDNDSIDKPLDKDYKIKSFFRIARIYERADKLDEARKIYQKIIDLGVEESRIAQLRLKELEVE